MRTRQRNEGFTLVEVMLASAVALLIFLVMFEALFFARRVAAENKLRLAADSLAYDLTVDLFNRDLEWFEMLNVTQEWTENGVLAQGTNTLWTGEVTYQRSVLPQGSPATNWVVTTTLQWTDAYDRSHGLPEPLVVYRQRNNR
ncbi:MAG: prepilin-type N-terminal cleavage/methylation domain-containing protein [Kiritimatiellae bacterium]|nr:prepilin-type N-terminal cleavage/methylation domain-containing protein [Kiritimatiellia bacterium]